MRNHSTYRFARKAAAREVGINWRDSTDKYTHGKVRYRPVRPTDHQPHQSERECAPRRQRVAATAARDAERLAALAIKVRKPRVRKAPVAVTAAVA